MSSATQHERGGRSFRSGRFSAALFALWLGAHRAPAEAQDYELGTTPMEPLLPVRIDGHASFTWDGEFGLGARVDIPVIEQGVLYSTRDELAVSLGMDVVFVAFDGGNPLTFWPTATVQWTLGITPKFSFYPEFGLALQIEQNDGFEGVLPNVGFGGRYHLYRSIAITGRLGWPMALSLGACF